MGRHGSWNENAGMKIAIIGAGAMGSLFGGYLALGGHEVSLIDVNADHVAAINAKGLVIERDGEADCARPRAGRPEDFTAAQDYLLVFTKGPHTEKALVSALHLVGEETWVLTAQNGLGNVEVITQHVPLDRIAIGTTSYAANLSAPGRLSRQAGGDLRIWAANGKPAGAVERLAEAITEAGLDCKADPKVESAIWEKVAFNAAINSVTAVTKYRVGDLADIPAGRTLAELVAKEVGDIACARGVEFDLSHVYRLMDLAFTHHREHRPSMLCDVLAGRETEIENINGAVVAEARRLGVQARATETLLLLVRLVERSTRT
jgi:2-dehydropantoate 2-reductase